MDEPDHESTIEARLDELRDNSGQSYILAGSAAEILRPFRTDVTREFVVEHTLSDADDVDVEPSDYNGLLALHGALEAKQRSSREARGITSVHAHKMLVTYSDVSAIIVEALGGEPSDYTAGGHGFTADGRHEENVEAIVERLDE
jgi:hypothetical protein